MEHKDFPDLSGHQEVYRHFPLQQPVSSTMYTIIESSTQLGRYLPAETADSTEGWDQEDYLNFWYQSQVPSWLTIWDTYDPFFGTG